MAERRRSELFVDKHRDELIHSVKNISPVLDGLLSCDVITKESYDKIMAIPDCEGKMRALLCGPLESSGVQGKRIFYKILNDSEPHLIEELKRPEHESVMDKVQFSHRTVESVIELLLETLADLNESELERFRVVILHEIYAHGHLSGFPLLHLNTTDMQDTVFLFVVTFGRQAVEKAKEVLKMVGRTDLVQRLSDGSSGATKKHSVDEHMSALGNKVAKMVAVKELLLETLKDLSRKDQNKFELLLQFTLFQQSLPSLSWEQIDLLVEMCGQQSVDVVREVFMDMNRTDLVQRLSEASAGSSEKHSVDGQWPVLIQEVETMASSIELLLETLADLTEQEFKIFRKILFKPPPKLMLLNLADIQDTVFVLVLYHGKHLVPKTKEVLEEVKRTDLVQRLSDRSSGRKKKHSAGKHHSALIRKVATMAAVQQLLLKTLKVLSDEEFEKFKDSLLVNVCWKNHSVCQFFKLRQSRDTSETVDLMVQIYGLKCLELTTEVLKEIKWTDLVQSLSKSSSEEHRPELFERVSATTAVEEVLSETLNYLSYEERKKFRWMLQLTCFQKNLPQIQWKRLKWAKSAELLAYMMVSSHGQQSVEVAKEVFMDMNRTDLAERLLKRSTGNKEEQQPRLFEKEVILTSIKKELLKTLKDLTHRELQEFKWHLQLTERMTHTGQMYVSSHGIHIAGIVETVELLVAIYAQKSEEVTRMVLKKMNKTDLVWRLSDISLGTKGPSRSLEHKGCGSIMQDSSEWTKLEPEVNSSNADEAPTYSVQCEAGSFECSVSGLRWVCKEKVSFKYKFCSWGDHMERIESLKYMPAGPLMDIKVIAGKLFEVYLPHWICIDAPLGILDKFAVLHIDDCGDVVEKAAEVTQSHVKLSEPVFSPRAVLMKAGFPVKISCNVLIYYQPNTAFLKLHVYLIPHDPALQQTVDKMEFSKGYDIIRKPRPDKYLKMHNGFTLTADIDTAKILPERITLRYDSQDPNFYEVFIENLDRNFHLTLSHLYTKKKQQSDPVWTREIRKDDYKNSGGSVEKLSANEHLSALLQAATIRTDAERLLETLEDLKQEEFKEFKWHLQKSDRAGFPESRLEKVDQVLDLVDVMLQTYSQQSVEETKKVLKKIHRNDLVQKLSDTRETL